MLVWLRFDDSTEYNVIVAYILDQSGWVGVGGGCLSFEAYAN